MKKYLQFSILIYFFFIAGSKSNLAQTRNNGNHQNLFSKNKRSISSVGEVTVKTWADDKKSAFSFTFDDGLQSQYDNVRPVMNTYGFHATYFLISSALVDSPPLIWRYGTWPEFQQLAAEGNEIGDHTVTHQDLTKLPVGNETTPGTITYELYQSKLTIEQKIPGIKLTTLAYPFCTYNDSVEDVAKLYYASARSCGSYTDSSTITGMNWYSVGSGDIRFDQPRNTLSDDQDEFNNYTNILQNQTIANGMWTVFLAHEVVPFADIASGAASSLYYPVSKEWLDQLCQWIKQKSDSNLVWVETFGNVTRYIKERQNFSYNLLTSNNSEIQFNPVDGLDDSVYNYPLTVDVNVPSSWQNVEVAQGASTISVATFSDGINTFARIHVVPDGGIVDLKNSSSGFEVSGKVVYENSAESPLTNVVVELINGADSLTTTTDTNGNYAFTNLNPGTYVLTAEKNDNWGGVNSTDALVAARSFSKLTVLDSLQTEAADVNNSGQVNSTDALLIARRFTNLIHSFSKPDWVFTTPITVSVSNSNVNEDIKALATGDVNKSYIP